MTEITIDDIFAEDGPISKLNENYKPRPSQIEAAKHIHAGLKEPSNVIIEGETGLGKSYAYLIPVCNEIANNPEKKAVIVTSGISLQEQLMYKDVPFAVKIIQSLYPHMEDEFSYMLLKGRQNFVCNLKADRLGIIDMKDVMLDKELLAIKEFLIKTQTGDFSELDFIPKQETLRELACTEKNECLGRNCECYDVCHYNNNKRKLAKANLIITNYHMLFSDLNSGGRILPEYDILVMDEAHETATIYRDFDSVSCSLGAMQAIRNKASQARNDNRVVENEMDLEPFQDCIIAFEQLSEAIKKKYPTLDSPKIISTLGEIPETFHKNLIEKLCTAENVSAEILEMFEYVDEDSTDEAKKSKSILQGLVSMCNDMYSFLRYLETTLKDDNNVAWLEVINGNASINVKKVDAGQSIYDQLLSKANLSAIFTSATITVAGSFDYIKKQVGIDLSDKKSIEYIGHSPFDLTKQQLWYLPENAIDGNSRDFARYVPSQLIEIIDQSHGGALCLFTSIKAMRDAYDFLVRQRGRQYNIMVQGDAPRIKLVERFREDKDSILLGTKSFFTGVDIPGDSLRCVIIDKFPFAQPTDPVQQKLMERDNAFFKYSIPEMIISLKQAVGRGVRSIDDQCVIAILDGRMSTARYKGRINNSFNYKKTGTRNILDIGNFLGYGYDPDEIPF